MHQVTGWLTRHPTTLNEEDRAGLKEVLARRRWSWSVPTVRLSRGVPPPASTVQPDPATQWRIVRERHAYDAEIRRSSVHRADSWTVHEKGTLVDSEAEARAAMAGPGARGCTICGTDQSLR